MLIETFDGEGWCNHAAGSLAGHKRARLEQELRPGKGRDMHVVGTICTDQCKPLVTEI